MSAFGGKNRHRFDGRFLKKRTAAAALGFALPHRCLKSAARCRCVSVPRPGLREHRLICETLRFGPRIDLKRIDLKRIDLKRIDLERIDLERFYAQTKSISWSDCVILLWDSPG